MRRGPPPVVGGFADRLPDGWPVEGGKPVVDRQELDPEHWVHPELSRPVEWDVRQEPCRDLLEHIVRSDHPYRPHLCHGCGGVAQNNFLGFRPAGPRRPLAEDSAAHEARLVPCRARAIQSAGAGDRSQAVVTRRCTGRNGHGVAERELEEQLWIPQASPVVEHNSAQVRIRRACRSRVTGRSFRGRRVRTARHQRSWCRCSLPASRCGRAALAHAGRPTPSRPRRFRC